MTSYNRLQELVDLAKEPSSEKRRDLLRNVTDIFLEAPDTYNAAERDHFSGIMGDVAREMEVHVRAELANRLSTIAEAPRDLVERLAQDVIEVAAPILENSERLSEAALLEIIREKGNEHRALVAGRSDVSEKMSDALVEHGNDAVVTVLVQNECAEIGRAAMSNVVKRAEMNSKLQAPLLDREDLPPDLMHDMFWFVSTALRGRILELSAQMDPDIVDRVLAQTEHKVLKDMAADDELSNVAHKFINDKIALRELSESLLVHLARDGRTRELIIGFARLAKVDESTAGRILKDPTGEGLAIACRAARFERATFSTLALLAGDGVQRTAVDTARLLELYDQVPHDIALRTMRFWRVRKSATEVAA